MTTPAGQPAPPVKYRYQTDEELEAAWRVAHRSHRVTEVDGCVQCHTCQQAHWRGKKR